MSCQLSSPGCSSVLPFQSNSIESAVLVKVVPTENNGSSELVKIQQTKIDKLDTEYFFTFQKIKYVWDDNKKQFRATEFPINRPYQEYFEAKGHEEDEALAIAEKRYGLNTMEMVNISLLLVFLNYFKSLFYILGHSKV